jgi:hypothetical protein
MAVMPRSFRVENHKSIRDEQELVFVPQYDKAKAVVPVAAVVGATSGYAVDVFIDGIRHDYGVLVDDEGVREEWLVSSPHGRRRMIFERKGAEVKFGSTVADRRSLGEMLARHTRDNALLLSVAAQNNLAGTLPVYHWFRSTILKFLVPRTARLRYTAAGKWVEVPEEGGPEIDLDSDLSFVMSDVEQAILGAGQSVVFHHGGTASLRLADQSGLRPRRTDPKLARRRCGGIGTSRGEAPR